jgi:CRISPR-associated endoribonuclease Cas6
MITQVRTAIETQDKSRISFDYAYEIYGALLKDVPSEFADFLHGDDIRPVNHYILLDAAKPYSAEHVINIFSEAARDSILPVILNQKSYSIPKYNCTLLTGGSTVTRIEESELANPYSASRPCKKRVTLRLLSPTTFKSDNRYAIFPTPELIIRSAAKRFGTLQSEFNVNDEEAIAQISESTVISDYNLHSFGYRMKDARIMSFLGSVTLSIRGPEPMIRLFDMLLNVLPYTGLGIKTSLGMGGVKIEEKSRT